MSQLRRTTFHSSFVALMACAALVLSLFALQPAAGGAVARPAKAPAASAAASAAHTSPSYKLPPGAKKALKQLVKHTGKVPDKAVKARSRAKLATLLALARAAKANAAKQTCRSVKQLASYRKTATSTKVLKKPKKRAAKTLDKLAALNTSSAQITMLLLGSPKTKK